MEQQSHLEEYISLAHYIIKHFYQYRLVSGHGPSTVLDHIWTGWFEVLWQIGRKHVLSRSLHWCEPSLDGGEAFLVSTALVPNGRVGKVKLVVLGARMLVKLSRLPSLPFLLSSYLWGLGRLEFSGVVEVLV